jgi:Zn-dependent peptidase ImmA (M78 family)
MAMPSKVKKEAAEDAQKLLNATWFGGIPVDPVAIARKTGLRVLDVPLDTDTMGALVKRPGEEPTILISQSDHENRKRFTCAHELGHFVRRSEETEQYYSVDLRSSLSSSGRDPEEIYANEFAASLLMPPDDVRIFVQAGLSDLEIAVRFKVSRETVQNRLTNLYLPQ